MLKTATSWPPAVLAGIFIILGQTLPEAAPQKFFTPEVVIAVLVRNKAHTLSYFFGGLENLEYPKDKITIWIRSDHNQDDSIQCITKWVEGVRDLYKDIVFKYQRGIQSYDDEKSAFHWPKDRMQHVMEKKDEALDFARDLGVDYIFMLDADVFLTEPRTISFLIQQAKPVIAPMLRHVVNTKEFGYILPLQTTTADDDMAHLEFLLLNSLEYGLPGLLPSSVLEPKFRPPTKLGFDQIYLVNLDRRPDRKERSEALFRILGIEATRISAVDGRNIDQQYIDDVGINFLPNYSDPYYERPMTRGEIGCFMSHYHIWQDVVENGYKQVILFEDDLQFAIDARRKLIRLRDEIEERKLEYDLLYIGRKRLSDEEEIKNTHYLEGSRLIATVGYTYWTLGYLLTQSGARKLIDAKPLKNLLPVDEYLPVMFDKHPTEDWYRHFPDRNLIAFTTEPLIVEPVLYRGEEGYVSDTEESLLAFGDEKGRKKAFMPGDQHLDDANRGDQKKSAAKKTEL